VCSGNKARFILQPCRTPPTAKCKPIGQHAVSTEPQTQLPGMSVYRASMRSTTLGAYCADMQGCVAASIRPFHWVESTLEINEARRPLKLLPALDDCVQCDNPVNRWPWPTRPEPTLLDPFYDVQEAGRELCLAMLVPCRSAPCKLLSYRLYLTFKIISLFPLVQPGHSYLLADASKLISSSSLIRRRWRLGLRCAHFRSSSPIASHWSSL